MLEWLIDSIIAVITMILSWFGIDYAKMGEKSVELLPATEAPSVFPSVSPVASDDGLTSAMPSAMMAESFAAPSSLP